jgi:hypothetical protein
MVRRLFGQGETMTKITEEYIDETIGKLRKLNVDFDEYEKLSDRYNRYLKKFEKAKKLISYSSDTSSLFPLENPSVLIYKLALTLDENERKQFLERYDRVQLKEKIEWEFDNLDKQDKHRPPKS